MFRRDERNIERQMKRGQLAEQLSITAEGRRYLMYVLTLQALFPPG